jgi:hypothetical protein
VIVFDGTEREMIEVVVSVEILGLGGVLSEGSVGWVSEDMARVGIGVVVYPGCLG